MNKVLKRKFTVVFLSMLLIISSAPLTGYGFCGDESKKTDTVSREYILTSDGDLSRLQLPEHVIYADISEGMALIKIDSERHFDGVEKNLKRQLPDMELQPNYIYEETTVNDPFYSAQWGLWNSANGVDVDFEEANAFVKKHADEMRDTVVAVIDSGIDTSHSDLKGSFWINKGEIPGNGKDDDKNGYVDDLYGYDFYNDSPLIDADFSKEYNHGTHCGGIINAVTDNHIGIAGIGSSSGHVFLMNLKVLGGKQGNGDTFNVVKAIRYAEKQGADICNLSMCSNAGDSLLYRTIADSKMLFVCASGNSGANLNGSPTYPGCYELNNIICVANLNSSGYLHRTSNYSETYADIAAPGVDIYSTVTQNGYRRMTGTSMAAPFVSGAAALIHSYYRDISSAQIRKLLMESAAPENSLSGYVACGGYLNIYRALTFDSPDSFVPDKVPPELSLAVSDIKGSYKQRLSVSASDNSGDTPQVMYARGTHTKGYFRSGKGFYVDLDENNRGKKTISVPGPYTVYASDESGNEVIRTVKCTADAVKTITLNASKKTIHKGNSFRIKATLSKSGKYGRTLTYSSSDKTVAQVSSTGKITGKKRGTAVITVKTGNLLTAKCAVTVR